MDLIEDLSELRENEKCRDCVCLYEVLRLFEGLTSGIRPEPVRRDSEISGWLGEGRRDELHDCLGCDPCLPVEIYNRMRSKMH